LKKLYRVSIIRFFPKKLDFITTLFFGKNGFFPKKTDFVSKKKTLQGNIFKMAAKFKISKNMFFFVHRVAVELKFKKVLAKKNLLQF
jgi:hypothetical protein